MGYSLQRRYNALHVESVSKLGYFVCLYWGPSDGQLSGLIPLSGRPDPSFLATYSSPSFLRVPRTPLAEDTRMPIFEYPPIWIQFHVRVGWTMLAGHDIGLPLTLLSQFYTDARCFDAESHSSKVLV